MAKRTSKRGDFEIEELDEVELAPDLEAKVNGMIEQADKDLEECRVNFRWQSEPLSLVKAVAAAMGVPYQTYMKMALYQKALEDWRQITLAGSIQPKSMKISELLVSGGAITASQFDQATVRAPGGASVQMMSPAGQMMNSIGDAILNSNPSESFKKKRD